MEMGYYGEAGAPLAARRSRRPGRRSQRLRRRVEAAQGGPMPMATPHWLELGLEQQLLLIRALRRCRPDSSSTVAPS